MVAPPAARHTLSEARNPPAKFAASCARTRFNKGLWQRGLLLKIQNDSIRETVKGLLGQALHEWVPNVWVTDYVTWDGNSLLQEW